MAETYSKDEMTRRMKGAVDTVKSEFAGLRTGRAFPGGTLLPPLRRFDTAHGRPGGSAAGRAKPSPRTPGRSENCLGLMPRFRLR